MKIQRLIILFFFLPNMLLAQSSKYIGKNAFSAMVYDYSKTKSQPKLISQYFFNGKGDIIISVDYKDNMNGYRTYSYDDSDYCIGYIDYDSMGKIISTKVAKVENNKKIPFLFPGIVDFCGWRNKCVSCKYDKFKNVIEAIRKNENTGVLDEKYKIVYHYK